jgi:hypothetical protein
MIGLYVDEAKVCALIFPIVLNSTRFCANSLIMYVGFDMETIE